MARETAAINEIVDQSAKIQGALFALFGAIAGKVLGNAFKIEDFARYVGTLEKNLIPADAQLTLAATTAFADGTWTFTCPADRFRMIVNYGITLSNGANSVYRGVVNQLNHTGQLRINRNTGKAVTMPFRAFNLGTNPARVEMTGDTNASAGTPITFTNAMQAQDQPLLEALLAPLGMREAMVNAMDVLGPNDTHTVNFQGLNGATLNNSQSGLVGALHALCIDAVQSGR